MIMKEITSIHNPVIQSMRALEKPKARREAGLFLIEGRKMAAEAMAAGLLRTLIVERGREEDYEELIASAETSGECVLVSAQVMQTLSSAKTPQGVMCAARIPDQPERLEGGLLCALDAVQDPGNLGTILRTLDAAGFGGVLLGEGCADPYGPKALRATMGSIFRVPIRQTSLPDELEALRRSGYAIAATELGGEDFFEACPSDPAVLVIGNEGNGISDAVRAQATHHLALPMRGGAESLNAAVAAGIMIYEMARRPKGV